MNEEKKTSAAECGAKTTPKGACPICGFITPFNPEEPGYCCPVCGSPSGKK